MNNITIKIAVIAGEDSGDLLGAELMKNLLKIHPFCEFVGVGGDKMVNAGLNLITSNKEFAIMGFAEVFKKLPKLLKLRKHIVKKLVAQKPDVFIGIDAPDLNFPIEKKLKQHGVKIIHYVSPSIWAWREKRAIKISQITDLVMTLFPFEPAYYKKVAGNAVFVGHPLAENISINIDKKKAKEQLGVDSTKQYLALLPGSRTNELKAHTEIFIQTALKLKEKQPNLRIISANTNQEKIKYIQNIAHKYQLEIHVYDDATNVLKAADFTLLASGTVALEAMLCKTPMVVAYKISPLTYAIVKTFNMMLLPYFSLPNVLYGDFLVPELLQKNMTIENLEQQLLVIMSTEKQEQLKSEFKKMHQALLSPNNNAANAVVDFLKL